MNKIYMDHIAGNPVSEEVMDAMLPYLKDVYGNPQSMHLFGEEAKEAIEEARGKVAELINAKPGEIYFTSSGTESNNFALKGIVPAYAKKGKHIIISAVEHQSVLYSAKALEKTGCSVSYVPVDKYGVVNPEDVLKAVRPETVLVSVMYANSEVGSIQPVAEIAKAVREKGIIFHTDAVAAAGNIPVDVEADGVDSLSMSASQFYGPKGAGALYIRKGTRVIPFLDGGIQEEGRRAGTENIPGIAGMGKAAELAKREMYNRSARLKVLRDTLLKQLPEKIDRIYPTGHPEKRLPNHASFCVEFIEGEAMLLNLSMEGIAVSSGSACTSRALKSSHVLKAMGVDDAVAQGSVVMSMGISNTGDDIRRLLEVFPPIVDKLRKMSPLYTKHLNAQKRGGDK